MKRLMNNMLAMVPVLALMASCETVTDTVGYGKDRVITVSSVNVDTRTTIDYELSDYSHLVWDAGDKVAYVTDMDSDLSSVVEVKDGCFDAEIPAGYGPGNKLYVFYPSDELEGLNIDKMKMDLPAEQHQDTLGSSKGIVVPMYAVAEIPGEGVNTMQVRYEFPAAVLRFAVRSDEHKSEKVLSVTMKANEGIAGTMVISRPSNEVQLIKPVNEVTAVVDDPSVIEKGGYLYMKVMRGVYENVTIEVTTDQNTYKFENGTFDLTNPDASLFKVPLQLDASQIAPQQPYYREISEGEVFSANAKYLIAYKASDTKYYVASSYFIYYLLYTEFEAGEDGIEATADVSKCAFTIAPVEGTEYVTLYSDIVGADGNGYLGSPATTYLDSGHFCSGSEADFDNPEAPLRYYWKMGFEDGHPTINSVQVDGYQIAYEIWGMQFAPCKTSYADKRPIVILKLYE